MGNEASEESKAVKEIFVRIKPYNPRKGHLKQRFFTFFGFNFRESNGWQRMQATITHGGRELDVEEYLRSVRQDENDPDSEPVFDVCTSKKEALALAAREKKEAEEKRTPDTAEVIGGANNPREIRTRGDALEPLPRSGSRSERGATDDALSRSGSRPERGRHSRA